MFDIRYYSYENIFDENLLAIFIEFLSINLSKTIEIIKHTIIYIAKLIPRNNSSCLK